MKQLTCKQIGGACDYILTGETPADIAKAASDHIESMAKTDPAHKKSFAEMKAIYEDKDRHTRWQKTFAETWAAAHG